MPNEFSRFAVRKFAKLAALGAVGVSVGVLGLYALIPFGSAPSPTGGIDRTHEILTWISAAIPAVAIIAAHLAYAKVLWNEAKLAAECVSAASGRAAIQLHSVLPESTVTVTSPLAFTVMCTT
jgi:hypothetical protein